MDAKNYRWESGRAIVQHMLPTLPGPSYVAVVMYCWFMARGKDNQFRESMGQIAKACRLSERQSRKIIADLERAGCVKVVHRGNRTSVPTRRIVRRKYEPPTEVGTGRPRLRNWKATTTELGDRLPDAEASIGGSRFASPPIDSSRGVTIGQ